MDWIQYFDLFLFDFDGLLVNSEHIHYQAYMKMLAGRGCQPTWNFSKFCSLAHKNASALKEAIYEEFPHLELDWNKLYSEKKEIYFNLIRTGKVELMPGAKSLLLALENAGIKRCVVTNSPYSSIDAIRSASQVLQTIPYWVTREDYVRAKPDPECYLLAIERYGKKGDKIIGFEDSMKGFTSLSQTSALAVLISETNDPLSEGILHFRSLEDISLP